MDKVNSLVVEGSTMYYNNTIAIYENEMKMMISKLHTCSLCEWKTGQKLRNQPFIMWTRSNSKFQLIKPSNIFVRCYLTISKQMYGQSNRH